MKELAEWKRAFAGLFLTKLAWLLDHFIRPRQHVRRNRYSSLSHHCEENMKFLLYSREIKGRHSVCFSINLREEKTYGDKSLCRRRLVCR